MKRVVILGGGIAGLAAARTARSAGAQVVLIEKNPAAGGLTRSIAVGGWIFDYAGHFLHLSRVSHPSQIGDGSSASWRSIPRRAGCWVQDRIVDAPFQYHARDLPEPLRAECIDGLRAALASTRDFRPQEGERLPDYFRRTFGEGIARHFLIPYNEKLLARELSDFPAHRLNRFFPFPDPEALRRSLDAESSPAAYNAVFWYPEHGGIERLVRQLDFPDFIRAAAQAIDMRTHTVKAGDKEYPWDALVSTIPLPDLLRAGPPSWQNAANALSCSGVFLLQLGISGPPPEILRGWHWVYAADPALPFFRLGVYSNISPNLAPRGCHSLYVETGFRAHEPPDLKTLGARVLRSLQDAGFVNPARIEVALSHILFPAYVHFDSRWEETVPPWRRQLSSDGVFTAGRYGAWDYIGMEDAIFQGCDAARQALSFAI